MAEKTIPFNQLAKAGYNRGIRRAHVNEIKNGFRDDMVQPAIVSFRDGRYYIVDHQHQSQAIFELNKCDPNTPILCKVLTGLTYEQEADLYYRLNTGSKPLNFNDKMVGRIEAKDPEALAFRDVVESCGYVIGGRANNSLRAVSLAWKMFEKDGGNLLMSVLTLTYACWPDNISGADSRIMEGIAEFLRHHQGEYQFDRFVKMLSPIDPLEIVRKSTDFYKRTDLKSFTRPYCVYITLLDYYNRGLKYRLTTAAPGTAA